MARSTKSEKVPKKMQEKFDDIVALTDQFCEEYLDEEYAQLARYATAALCRKRPSPLTKGWTRSWACGIVYALGYVNFLFDQSEEPYVSASELCEWFDVSTSTGGSKSRAVRDALDMIRMDPDWYRPSKMDENVRAWMISVDGLIVDARMMSREIQKAAYEQGLIPYIPADEDA